MLAFWFDEAATAAEASARWFGHDDAFDTAIRARFSALREEAIASRLDAWLADPHGRLALILLVDQFSRNLFRGDPRAFEHDPLARRWSVEGIDAGADRTLQPIERVFFYLPLEHSEALADQQRSVALFTSLRDEAPAARRGEFDVFLDYARRHHHVIARHGRFPHRNAVLGRTSTAEEAAYLAQPGAGF
ncbi:MAG: DUF924 domain-containing protein [Lysobacteraceae bacterium]|nr:MAG: DUF924 domain-containing protein [Xanthomonadaceae bacterium]